MDSVSLDFEGYADRKIRPPTVNLGFCEKVIIIAAAKLFRSGTENGFSGRGASDSMALQNMLDVMSCMDIDIRAYFTLSCHSSSTDYVCKSGKFAKNNRCLYLFGVPHIYFQINIVFLISCWISLYRFFLRPCNRDQLPGCTLECLGFICWSNSRST